MRGMSAGLALVMLAQATAAALPSAAPPPAPPKPAARPADAGCRPGQRGTNPNEIVICAERGDGYRINPDLLQARREARVRGRPTRPGPGGMKDRTCVVGPAGCGPPAGINLVSAALTAVEMAQRVASGREIGSMFVTDPTPSEYQLYAAAKAQREAEEADKAAKAAVKATEGKPR